MFECVLLSLLCSSPHVDRCSIPPPWDPLSFPELMPFLHISVSLQRQYMLRALGWDRDTQTTVDSLCRSLHAVGRESGVANPLAIAKHTVGHRCEHVGWPGIRALASRRLDQRESRLCVKRSTAASCTDALLEIVEFVIMWVLTTVREIRKIIVCTSLRTLHAVLLGTVEQRNRIRCQQRQRPWIIGICRCPLLLPYLATCVYR